MPSPAPEMALRSCSNCPGDGGRRRCGACYDTGDAGGGGIMLFGVRLTEAPLPAAMRKSASLGNLAQYEHPADAHADAGYASDDVLHHSGRSRERKRGVPWTEEEHRRFLQGLHIVGKGDWRAIAKQYVKTRTPTQVASHAQKYYLRRNNNGRRRRRSSLFDITTDNLTQGKESPNFARGASGFNAAAPEDTAVSMNVLRPTPKIPAPPRSLDLDLNEKLTIEPSTLSLHLLPPISSLPPSNPKPMLPRHSAFHSVPSFNGGSLNSKPGDAIFVT